MRIGKIIIYIVCSLVDFMEQRDWSDSFVYVTNYIISVGNFCSMLRNISFEKSEIVNRVRIFFVMLTLFYSK